MFVLLGMGSRILEAVAIAGLSAVFTKAVEVAADEIKRSRENNTTPQEPTCSTSD